MSNITTRIAFLAALSAMIVFSAPEDAEAADYESVERCAVSSINGKLEAAAGFINNNVDDGARGHGLGSLSLPLGCMLGLQIDAGYGQLAGTDAGGVAAHLFTRDPSSHLLGIYAQWGAVGRNDVWRIAGEGELYLDQFSLEAIVGYEETDFNGGDAFVAADIAYYFSENLRFSVGFSRFFKTSAANIGVEWMPEGFNLGVPASFFIHSGFGSNKFATVYAGVRLYFGGEQKSPDPSSS